MCDSMHPNLFFKSMQIRMDMWICSIIHELSKVQRRPKWESGRALFILSILFNISEIADIMGDLTDGMRDLTGVINWRTHRWR